VFVGFPKVGGRDAEKAEIGVASFFLARTKRETTSIAEQETNHSRSSAKTRRKAQSSRYTTKTGFSRDDKLAGLHQYHDTVTDKHKLFKKRAVLEKEHSCGTFRVCKTQPTPRRDRVA